MLEAAAAAAAAVEEEDDAITRRWGSESEKELVVVCGVLLSCHGVRKGNKTCLPS